MNITCHTFLVARCHGLYKNLCRVNTEPYIDNIISEHTACEDLACIIINSHVATSSFFNSSGRVGGVVINW